MSQGANERRFCTVITKKEKASRETISEMADRMARLWHKKKLLRREIPLFTRFFLSQADLEIMEGLNKGPISCGDIDGEHEYDKDLLKLWFIEEGHLAGGIGGNEINSLLIPSCWYGNGIPPSPDLDPYEIMLHRHAEEGGVYARAFVENAVMWDAPFVALADVEEFTKGALSSEAFWRLLVLATGSEESVPAGDSLYEKWEFAHFCFTLFSTLPKLRISFFDDRIALNNVNSGVARVGSISAGYEKLAKRKGMTVEELKQQCSQDIFPSEEIDDDEFAAILDMKKAARKIVFTQGDVFDHYEFITWLQSIVLLLPDPICLD